MDTTRIYLAPDYAHELLCAYARANEWTAYFELLTHVELPTPASHKTRQLIRVIDVQVGE